MPAPTTKCSVCGDTVLKAQTRHVGDGKRACKSHDGVVATAEQVHSTQLAALQNKRDQERQRRERRHEHREHAYDRQMRCHVCNHAVAHVADLLMETVIASKTHQMAGSSANILTNPEQIVNDVRAVAGDVIGCFVYDKSELTDAQWNSVCNGARRDLRDGIRMFGFVCACVKCMKKFGLPNKLDNMPQPSFEQLVTISAVMEPLIESIVLERQRKTT